MGQDPRQRELVAAIAASPEEDGPALVYADWLEERGDGERAQFIRAQIERERLSPFDPRSLHLSLREEVLLAANDERWRAELPKVPARDNCEVSGFCRGVGLDVGFEEVLRSLQVFAEAHREVAPVIRAWCSYLDLRDRKSQAPIESLRSLDAGSFENLARFIEMPLLSTLTELSFDGRYLESGDTERLLSSPHTRKLESLHLEDILVGNEFMSALASADPPALRRLELPARSPSQMPSAGEFDLIDREGIEELCAWSGLARLETLDLSGHALGTAGLRALLASPLAAGLRRLRIRGVGSDVDLLTAFGDAHPDLKLQELQIGRLTIDESSIEALSGASCLERLELLGVSAAEPTGGAWELLSRAPWFGQLRVLSVSQSPVDALMRALCERMPPSLHTLLLGYCFGRRSPEESFAELLRSSSADSLLSLSFNTETWPSPAWSALLEGSLRGLLRLSFATGGGRADARADVLSSAPVGQRLISLQINDRALKPRSSAASSGG